MQMSSEGRDSRSNYKEKKEDFFYIKEEEEEEKEEKGRLID